MSLESQITALVSAANKLTSEVANKMKGIDNKVDKATTAVDEFLKSSTSRQLYVDPINGDDGNDGTSWAKAKRTISGACTEVPDSFLGVIRLAKGEHILDRNVSVAGKVITLIGSSSDKEGYVIRGMPYLGESSAGVTFTFSTSFLMGLRGYLVAAGVTFKTLFVEDSSSPAMRAYSGSLVSSQSAHGMVLLQHSIIEVNHGPFLHQHDGGSFGTCDLRMRAVTVEKGSVGGSTYTGLRYLIDQNGEEAVPYELYGTSVELIGFSSWADAVRVNHANITSNLL
ncbi:hypothetical protein QT231_13635 [Halomonas sp. SpR1]|uniref:hypothetical protein n=1 Tax=Halomonas sp. SpR1 TaxID=3050462 RepID=UPI0027E58F8C|nr:hypothetical protein [Halomonas sp. SpR1]MDQ7733749.1 hypothetical protein [Halomonas sp. SpR1]